MDKYKQSKNIPDLATALLESEQYAKRGHKLAGDAVSLLKRTVDSISRLTGFTIHRIYKVKV